MTDTRKRFPDHPAICITSAAALIAMSAYLFTGSASRGLQIGIGVVLCLQALNELIKANGWFLERKLDALIAKAMKDLGKP